MKSRSLCEKREVTVSLRSRCQLLILPERFEWTSITSQSEYYISLVSEWKSTINSCQGPGLHHSFFGQRQVLDCIKEFWLLFSEEGALFLDVPQRY